VKIKPPEKEVTQGVGGFSLINGIEAHQWSYPTINKLKIEGIKLFLEGRPVGCLEYVKGVVKMTKLFCGFLVTAAVFGLAISTGNRSFSLSLLLMALIFY